jgi:hypothetical protein
MANSMNRRVQKISSLGFTVWGGLGSVFLHGDGFLNWIRVYRFEVTS